MRGVHLGHVEQAAVHQGDVGGQVRDPEVGVVVGVRGDVVGRRPERRRDRRGQRAGRGERAVLVALVKDDVAVVGRPGRGDLLEHREDQSRSVVEIHRARLHLLHCRGGVLQRDVARDQVRPLAREPGDDVLIQQRVADLRQPEGEDDEHRHDEGELDEALAALGLAAPRAHSNLLSLFMADSTATCISPSVKNGRRSGVSTGEL